MKSARYWLALLAYWLVGCLDQHYVSPLVVALVIKDGNGTVVNACHYVPVLLGSRSQTRYALEPDLDAVITLNRDAVRVSFEGAAAAQAFEVPSSRFATEASEMAPMPPGGYTIELRSPCQPQ